MREKYSNGFHSEVFVANPQDKFLFPHGDLVKEDISLDPKWPQRLFYKHAIASLLFPKNFIEVVAIRIDQQNTLYYESAMGVGEHGERIKVLRKMPFLLYSRKEQIDPEHATFSSHITIGNGADGKVSSCECVPCIVHREKHASLELDKKALFLGKVMAKKGIIPPVRDPSDYCIKEDGNLVFFELQFFDDEAVKKYLLDKKSLSSQERHVLQLTDRFIKLLNESRHSMLEQHTHMMVG